MKKLFVGQPRLHRVCQKSWVPCNPWNPLFASLEEEEVRDIGRHLLYQPNLLPDDSTGIFCRRLKTLPELV